MLTFSTGTKIKGPHRQKIGNALEMSKPLKKSEFGPREGGELITYTPESHGQSSCMSNNQTIKTGMNIEELNHQPRELQLD